MNMPPAPVTEYSGFDLALGSVFAVRWFRPDRYGRLHAINYKHVWKPGENVAECRKSDDGWLRFTPAPLTFTFFSTTTTTEESDEGSLSKQAVKARVEVEHLVPMDSCRCGFYAFAENCDSGEYVIEGGVRGVVECYGRTILGTRGLRCEKARIVALTTDRADIKRAYPDVRFFDPARKRRLRRSNAASQMLAAFDLVQPFTPNPETDPELLGAAMSMSLVSDTKSELLSLARLVAEDSDRRTFAFELVPLLADTHDALRLFDCLTEAVAEQEALHNDPRSYLEARDFPLRSVDRIADSLAGNVEGLLDQLTAGLAS